VNLRCDRRRRHSSRVDPIIPSIPIVPIVPIVDERDLHDLRRRLLRRHDLDRDISLRHRGRLDDRRIHSIPPPRPYGDHDRMHHHTGEEHTPGPHRRSMTALRRLALPDFA
jgi:hypothetical protein